MGFYKKIVSNKNRSTMEIGNPTIRLIRERIGTSGRKSVCELLNDSTYRSVNVGVYYDVRELIWDPVRLTIFFGVYQPAFYLIDRILWR